MQPSAEELRQQMRLRARRRAEKEGISFSRALARVRRSEVLLFLSRNQGRYLTYPAIAEGSAVPLGAVRGICERLRAEQHELVTVDRAGKMTVEEGAAVPGEGGTET